jgi:hypothetical protein
MAPAGKNDMTLGEIIVMCTAGVDQKRGLITIPQQSSHGNHIVAVLCEKLLSSQIRDAVTELLRPEIEYSRFATIISNVQSLMEERHRLGKHRKVDAAPLRTLHELLNNIAAKATPEQFAVMEVLEREKVKQARCSC